MGLFLSIHELTKYGCVYELNNYLESNPGHVDLLDEYGRTPLMVAFEYLNDTSNIECVMLLINFGANMYLSKWSYILHSVCAATVYKYHKYDNAKLLKYILDTGVDVNLQEEAGFTALMYACCWSDIECVKILIDCGADVNVVNKDGKTALMIADMLGHSDIVKLLVGNENENENKI